MSKPYNELLNDQADAMSGIPKYCATPRFLHNPEHPEENYNQAWLDAIAHAEPAEISPILKGIEMAPLRNQLDLVKGDLKPVDQALKDAARDTNERIKRNAANNPRLKSLYQELTGRLP